MLYFHSKDEGAETPVFLALDENVVPKAPVTIDCLHFVFYINKYVFTLLYFFFLS